MRAGMVHDLMTAKNEALTCKSIRRNAQRPLGRDVAYGEMKLMFSCAVRM